MIYRLYDANEKFEYFNTVGGFVIKRESDRLARDTQKSFIDDAWSAFKFFYLYFHKYLHPQRLCFLQSLLT